MSFPSKISKVLRSNKFLQSQGVKWQRKASVAPIRFHRTMARTIGNLEGPKGAVKSVLILSYNPRYPDQREWLKDSMYEGILDVLLIAARIFVIGSVMTGLAIAYLVTRFTQGHVFPTILCKSMEFLGPTFIKLGQWASTRTDLFPENICRTLTQLQRSACPHSWIYTKQLLKAVYGTNWRNIFVKFENQVPIGSGCCAQVYKAWVDLDASVEVARKPRVPILVQIIEHLGLSPLWVFVENALDDNVDEPQHGNAMSNQKLQPVAVKILHPGIKGQLRRDLHIMRWICKCVTYMAPQLQWLSLTDCIDEFSQIMENQVDLNLEAANLIQFSKNFSEKRDVIFPRPYVNFSQCEVLVESFHEGAPISNYLDDNNSRLQQKLAKIGLNAMLQMVFRDNFIHCDLHPGNILVQRNTEPCGSIRTWFWKFIDRNYLPDYPRLVILDCGLVVSLNNRCRKNLKAVLRSVLMGNGELAAEYMLEQSPRVSPDPDGFKSTLKAIVNAHLRNRRNVNVSTVVSELFSAMVRHRVKQEGSFSTVILSMAIIEGLGRSLDPNIDVFTEVVPFIFASAATTGDD